MAGNTVYSKQKRATWAICAQCTAESRIAVAAKAAEHGTTINGYVMEAIASEMGKNIFRVRAPLSREHVLMQTTKTPTISANITYTESNAIHLRAKELGLSISDYIRKAVNDYAGEEIVTIQPRGKK